MYNNIDKNKVIEVLKKILELELAGVVRYTHYSFMVYGYNRIPIVAWLKDQAKDSQNHAYEVGELITSLGGHPSLGIGPLLETHKHNIGDILRESLEHERSSIVQYKQLLGLVKDKSISLEEYARRMIETEENHVNKVDKMLRNPGDLTPFEE